MGVHRQGYYTKYVPASEASSDSQAVLVTSSETHTNMHAHTLLFFNFFILHERLTNLSVRACQPVRTQWYVYSPGCKWPVCLHWTTWVPVSLLSFSTAHSPGWLHSGRTDKAGHILTPVGLCSPLSRLNAVQDAAVLKCCGSVTIAWLTRGWRITRLTTRLFHPELIHPT